MKILLATLSIEPESRATDHPNAPYSIGLAYIQAVLEREGHETEFLFLNNVDQDTSETAFFASVDAWQPELVAFQIFSMNRVSTCRAIRRLTANYPGIRIVVGGVHVSVMYEQMVAAYPEVIAVRGEGELTIAQLVRHLEQGLPLDAVDGIAFHRAGGLIVTRPRDLLKDLDQLPFPRHETFFDSEPARTIAHMITSRGCPFDCSFCCLKVISLRRYRARSVDSVIEEIRHLKRTYPRLSRIQFHDDTLLLDNRRVIELCKRLIEEQFGLTYICSARVKPISAEMFQWMERAGFTKIMFGLETGSPRLLDAIHKKITPQDVITLFHTLKQFNFVVTTFLMCGFPGETEETVQETVDLVRATQRVYYNCIMGVGKLWVYPGTEVYDIMKQSGRISDEFWLGEQPVPYFTVEHDLAALMRFEETMMNHLSVARIFTWQGFVHHFLAMPLAIVRFLLNTRHKEILTGIVDETLRKRLGPLYPVIRKCYKSLQGRGRKG
jgi:radical SAM superfamily enzyme YgiQ (UPF0313 family)